MVLVDTSVFLSAYKKGDVFGRIEQRLENVEWSTTSSVLRELKHLGRIKGPRGMAARAGLLLAEKMHIIPTKGPADDSLLNVAREKNAVIATSDVELSQRALRRRVPVVFVSNSGYPKLLGW